jgi:nucleotide-sensitive chloride channel 1A
VEPIFEALSLCASLNPDAVVSEDDLDDAFVSVEDNAIPLFTGDEDEELSEIGRVRSDFFNDNRFMPY